MVVFDFDKTLTDRDTIFGFYKEVHKDNRSFHAKKVILQFFAVLCKTGIISNSQLKSLGVWLFLHKVPREKIIASGKSYVRKIHLNNVYKNEFLTTPRHNRMVISASFIEYLQFLLKGEHVLASELLFMKNRVKGVKLNMYGPMKKKQLSSLGIERIDSLFTDSFSDKPLMDIAENVYLIKNGSQKKIK